MHPTFVATVSALVYSLVEEYCGSADGRDAARTNQAVRFVLEQHGRMPDYLRLPLLLFTVAFDLWSIPRHAKRFHRLAPELRRQQVISWKRSRLGVRRDLVRFYETLTVYGWYAWSCESEGV
jgi:hypothetical protein